MNKKILFYPSGHGFGHAVRQLEIIKEIFKHNLESGARHEVIVRTAAPRWIFERSLSLYFAALYPEWAEKVLGWFNYSNAVTDVGTVQSDSLVMDIAATFEAARNFYSNFNERVALEKNFIIESGAEVVVGDIPPLAFAAAAAAGVRSVGVTNFSWDFIYEEFVADNAGFVSVIDRIREAYSKCRTLFRLPFACPLPAFGYIADCEMIARKPYIEKAAAARAAGVTTEELEGKTVVMISFGGFDTRGIMHANLRRYSDEMFFLTTIPPAPGEVYPTNVRFIDTAAAKISFENLFTLFDVIVTKPGYGVIGDILGAGAACLYTDRGRFREYDYLVKFLEKHCAAADYISRDELLNCEFKDKIKGLLARRDVPLSIGLNGAKWCAMNIIE